MAKHDGSHQNCPPCYKIKLRSVSFAPSAMPNRHVGATRGNALDKQRERDLPAYKRLVDSGVQPKSTVGAADVEARSSVPIEVESGINFGKDANRAQRMQNELGDAMKAGKVEA